MRFVSKLKLSLSVIVVAFGVAACGGSSGKKILEKVTYTPSPDLTSVEARLVFHDSVKLNLMGSYDLKDYGQLFVVPYSQQEPFQVGLTLDLTVFKDGDYVNLEPTSTFPNGVSMGLPNPLVKIQGASPVGDKFDLMGYVDITRGEWLGVAVILNFLDDKVFPEGLAVTQNFSTNAQGKPGAIATLFGPQIDESGQMIQPGGIAFLANVKQLAEKQVPMGMVTSELARTSDLYSSGSWALKGPQAKRHKRNPKQLMRLMQAWDRATSK